MGAGCDYLGRSLAVCHVETVQVEALVEGCVSVCRNVTVLRSKLMVPTSLSSSFCLLFGSNGALRVL